MLQPSHLVLIASHFALSAIVTLHVLLHKRNVHSATGWIGLAWLSPFVGALLYFGFGINRVQRRARILNRSPKRVRLHTNESGSLLEPFTNLKATVGAVTHQDLAAANISMPLQDGDDAYPQMLAAINNAKTTIALASYIFRADRIGLKFVQALAEAVARGVMVRVLIDGFGSGIFLASTYRTFRKLNVPAARFMHSIAPWRVQYLNLRLHKKILIVDGAIAFIGGLNIADENTGRRRRKILVRDTHFKIEGPVVKQITMDFIEDWSFASGEILQESEWNPITPNTGTARARVIVSGPDQDAEVLSLVLLAAISSAQKSIRIATPYFLPGEQLMTALILAATRGVDVGIVIPMFNNHPPIGWAMQAHVGPLLQAGCRIWRAPLPFDHSKLMVVDNIWCLFGSPNWDTRSLRLNFEMAVEVYDSTLADQLTAVIDKNHGSPLTIKELEARSFLMKCRDAATRLLAPYL
ncbi:MAG: phospholipase D-like domain-containing protein [Aestuariivirga sp.]